MLITYNHGRFIGQALQSILDQQTEYSFVINVIEDCSTDNTQQVAREFQSAEQMMCSTFQLVTEFAIQHLASVVVVVAIVARNCI